MGASARRGCSRAAAVSCYGIGSLWSNGMSLGRGCCQTLENRPQFGGLLTRLGHAVCLSVLCRAIIGRLQPHLAERLNSLVTQSDGIALSSPGKLDDRFGYHCHCGIIAIDQTQLTDCIFKRDCEHRDSVWPKDFLFSLGGVRKRHHDTRLNTRLRLTAKRPNVPTKS